MRNYLPRVDWMVGTGLVVVAVLSVFYGSAELTSNIASGLIGFLGLIVPNVLRRFFSGQLPARKMLLLSALFGSVLLTAADFLARRLFYPYELPVGLLLSLLGAPFFIWMLMHRKRGI